MILILSPVTNGTFGTQDNIKSNEKILDKNIYNLLLIRA